MMGIYVIRNKVNRKVYVGQSTNIQKRFKQHLDALERGNHHSKKLQEDFDKLGPDKFAFEFLELCTREQLDQKEMEWISKFDSLRNGYNVQDPNTRKTWFFKRQKRPGVTVRGELSRILREVSLSLIYDFENWIKGNREAVQILTFGMSIALLIVLIILLGYLIFTFLGGFALVLYIAFVVLSISITGSIIEEKTRN